jgi:hypothetical protein
MAQEASQQRAGPAGHRPDLRHAGRQQVRRARQATSGGTGAATNWAVQVGAFSTRNQALSAARNAERQIGVARAEAEVTPVRSRNRTLFRAQVTNLTEAEARGACADRAKRKQACAPLPPATVAASHRPRG